jgi:hypothetical protein
VGVFIGVNIWSKMSTNREIFGSLDPVSNNVRELNSCWRLEMTCGLHLSGEKTINAWPGLLGRLG